MSMRWAGRGLAWIVLAGLALQLVFFLRVVTMIWIDPTSTAFQRSEAWRLATTRPEATWSHRWVPYPALSVHLKRAVIASEDASFAEHPGVDWDALRTAWARHQRYEAAPTPRGRPVRLAGGSTISQQLAKNLWLSGERTLWRKGQELLLTLMLESVLSKERILEIYLNHVEWGEGIFGAEAAAQHYFRKPASRLTAQEAARLAVMLPAPKRFQRNPYSGYLNQRTSTIVARMGAVTLP